MRWGKSPNGIDCVPPRYPLWDQLLWNAMTVASLLAFSLQKCTITHTLWGWPSQGLTGPESQESDTSAVRSMLLALPLWPRQKTTQVHSFSRLLLLLYSAPLTPLNIFLPEEQALSKSHILESWSQAVSGNTNPRHTPSLHLYFPIPLLQNSGMIN